MYSFMKRILIVSIKLDEFFIQEKNYESWSLMTSLKQSDKGKLYKNKVIIRLSITTVCKK